MGLCVCAWRIRALAAAAFLASVMLLVLTVGTAAAQNPVVIENQQPGSAGWDVDQDALGTDAVGQIKGYASAVSVNKGQNISLFVSVNAAQTYTIDIYRIGWYQGLGGRLMQHIGPLNGVKQAACPVNPTYGTIECHWTPSYTLTVPTTWTSGIYVGTLINAQGFKNYLTFVVRDDSRTAALIYQQPVMTYQADNNWPNDGVTGKSTYDYRSYGPITVTGFRSAAKVSFDRPYYDSGLAGEDFNGDTAEINFVRWLEKSGYDVVYSTDVDTHANGARLLNYRGFLSVGHPEYWTKPMFDAVASARDAGVNLGFFSGNGIYWQARMEASGTGVANRVLVCYKDELIDPIADRNLVTTLWRGNPPNRPEQLLMGVQYTVSIPQQNNQGFFPSFVVTNPSHWVFAGTGFLNGTAVRGLVGYETDRVFTNYPAPPSIPGSFAILSRSPWGTGPDDFSNSVIYQAPSGAWVYTTGSMNWNYGLDGYGHGYNLVDARIQRTAANVLDRFVSGTQTPSPTVSSVAPASGPIAGGTAITITGTNFASGATVSVGGTAATGVTVVNSTTMTATTPAHAAGPVSVTVTNSDGRNGTLSSAFTYSSTAPTVDTVAPSAGPTTGGTGITLTGTNYATGATVSVGGTAASGVTVVNGTRIDATTPAHAAGSVNVIVTNTNGQSGSINPGFTFLLPAPTVTGMAPASGSATGGTAITVTGTNFRAGATLSIGGTAATGVTVVGATTITATTPPHVAGVVTITVTNSDAQSASLTNGFTYTGFGPAPTITSIAPTSGPTTGGTALTISGTNFAAGAAVTVGGTVATAVTVVNGTTITATAPSHAAGAVGVTVTNADGQSGTLANAFTYATPTTITFVQVAAATPQSPTASVAVAFPTAQTPGDLNVVAVGINDATSAVQSVQDNAGNTYLLAIGPTTGTGLRQSIYYAKNIVGGATTVTVTFNQAASYADVRILEYRGVNTLDVTAGASGSGTAANSGTATTTGPNELIVGAMMVTSYTASVGAGFTGRIYTNPDSDLAEDMIAAAAGPVTATATSGGGNWVIQMAAFKLVTGGAPAPTVTGVAPTSGPIAGGTAITITGTSFVSGASVSVGGTAATAVTVVNATTITATTPAHVAGLVGVTVTNSDGQSGTRTSAFTYSGPAPTVTSVAPTSGPIAGGTAITITGNNFVSGATVSVGGTAATAVTVVNATTITATTPAHAAGLVSVTVTNADSQSGTLTSAFTYLAPAPTVTSVVPTSGPIAGGTAITITGTNFVSGATVNVGGTAATGVTVVNATTITATAPAHAAGAVSVAVTNTDSQSGTRTNAFTFLGPAPTVTSVAPTSGPIAGGTAITITGTNFVSGATVSVGGTAATGITVVNATTLTATTPAHAAGLVGVTVTNADGQSGTLANAFTYLAPAPTVTSVAPTSGPIAGGTAITITGTNFAAGATVSVGGTAPTGVTVVNATTITATTPAHAAGAVNVTVTNSDGQSGTRTSAFTYLGPAPTVSSVAPTSGPIAGGTAITITGTNFAAGATVSVGGTAATGVTVVNATTITATTPAHAAGAVNVTVTNSDGQSGTRTSAFTYLGPAPTVTSVAPTSGPVAGGTAITITGTNFVSGATVSVGGTAATAVTVVNATTITAATPAHAAGLVSVTVTNADSQSGTLASAFTYLGPGPTVTSVAPNSGPIAGGTAITITGTNFAVGATVSVGGTAATNVTIVNATTITAIAPAHAAGAVGVTVTNADSQSGTLASAFTYLGPAPTVSSVAPTSGPIAGGTAITITGTSFAAGATVSIGGTAATGVTVVNATTLTATTPAHAAGLVGVTVTNADSQSGTLASAFTYLAPAPTVASVAPTSGPLAGGTAITITGTNFVAGATVSVGGTAATGVTVVNTTTLTATTPAHAAGAVNVTVTNSDGQSGTRTSAFTYLGPAPTVSSVAPTSGPIAGGTAITITGANFVAGATVTVGGTAATGVTIVNATTITATTPAHAAGLVGVTVTNADSQSGTLASAFTYLGPAPTVTNVAANSGPIAGGTAVTITGTNFVSGATVSVGGTAATAVTVVNATTITATTPAHAAGLVGVTVTNVDSQSGTLASAFRYLAPAPTVTSVAPTSGPIAGGTTVTISGTNFAAGATVSIGGTAATGVTVVNPTTITGTAPAHAAGLVGVTVTNADSQSGTLVSAFTYLGSAPAVTSVAPTSGPIAGGTAITITGTSFAAGATLSIGGTAATGVTVVNSTTITATTPAHAAGAVGVTVTNADSQSGTLASAFTYLAPAPTVSSIAPTSGPIAGGTVVTITGTNFAAGATVTVGGTAATGVTIVNATTITATTPAHATGLVGVTVTNADSQSGTLANAFTYLGPAPAVTSVAPSSGTTAGGTALTITGTGFVAGATVTMDGLTVSGVNVVNSTRILTPTTPAHAAGPVSLTVTNPDTQTGTLVNAFTYVVPPPPTVTGIAPASGPTTGGTTVTITGTNFFISSGTTVSVDGSAATNVSVVNTTTITATMPAHAAGAVSVTVTNADTQSGTLASAFTYLAPAPTVTSIAPTSGLTTGGTTVTITGNNFVAGATVSVGGTAATGVTVVNAITITATTPAHATGAVDVIVANADGQSGTLTGGFTYAASGGPAPSITNVAPASGPTTGGTALTISGTNFVAGAAVTVGGTAATAITVVNATTITATAPAHAAGAADVTVTNTDGQNATLANAFNYATPTAITFVQVAAATPQTPTATVTVPFANAQTPGDLNVIAVGMNDATSVVQSVQDSAGNTYLLAIGPTTGTGLRQSIYYAKNIAGGANTVTVTFNQPAAYADVRILEYRGVNALDVAAGASGTGTAADSGTAITTGPNELIVGAMMVSSYTAVVGAGFTGRIYTDTDSDLGEDMVAAAAGPYSATATTGGGNWVMQMAVFKLDSGTAPSITTVAPTSGPIAGGTAITITGDNFAAGATVTIGGTAATDVAVVNSTTITATTAAHIAGAMSLIVTNVNGESGTLASAFTYLGPAPTVTALTPVSGSTSGGTAMTITGADFAAGATVSIGGISATGVTIVDSTTITATTPAHAFGIVNVVVTNLDGQAATLTNAFTYVAPAPTVTGINPTSGSSSGGTAVTVTGTGFLAGAAVTIGGTAATAVTVVNNTTITATTPAHAAGAASITVTNPDAQSATLANGFTFTTQTITVTAPNTAVSWRVGDNRNVTFSHNLGVGQVVNIDVSRDGGATWSLVSTFTTTSATSGTYAWAVSGPPTSQARIRVTWSVDGTVTDFGNVNFTILSRTTVTAPNTAVTWGAGSTRQVTWSHNLGLGGLVDIDFSPDNGNTWVPVAAGVASSAATTGTYTGPMPTTVTTQGLIRVSPSSDPTLGDVSNVPFTLAAPTVTVTAPNTNVSWAVGTTQAIRWNQNLGTLDFVRIELTRDGVNYTETIAASAPNTANANGTFNWIVTGPSTTTARIRITWVANGTITDISNVNFTIP